MILISVGSQKFAPLVPAVPISSLTVNNTLFIHGGPFPNDVHIFFSHFLSSSNDCQSEGLLDHCEDEEVASNNAQPHESSHRWWWPQTSDRSFTSWKKRLRHSIEVVRQFRGHRPREYSINEDAPPLRPPGSHTIDFYTTEMS